jgi:hypothetical protein
MYLLCVVIEKEGNYFNDVHIHTKFADKISCENNKKTSFKMSITSAFQRPLAFVDKRRSIDFKRIL